MLLRALEFAQCQNNKADVTDRWYSSSRYRICNYQSFILILMTRVFTYYVSKSRTALGYVLSLSASQMAHEFEQDAT